MARVDCETGSILCKGALTNNRLDSRIAIAGCLAATPSGLFAMAQPTLTAFLESNRF